MSRKLIIRPLTLGAFLALTAAVVWLAVGGPSTAEGHGVQLSSVPAPNEQLTESPQTVSVTFSEPVEPSVTTIQLWDTAPTELDISAPSFPAEDTMTASIPEDLPSGIYTVIWRNLSTVDGHTWAGSFTFVILGPGGQVPEGEVPASLQELAQEPSNTPTTLDTMSRWIVLLGSAVMLGGVAYVMVVVLPSARVLSTESGSNVRSLSLNILIVTTAFAAFLVLQGSLIQLLDQADKLGGLGRADELLTDTRFGKFLIARQGLLLAALLSLALVWRAGKGTALALALVVLFIASFGVLFTQSMVSHAAGSDGAFWKIGADLLHLVTASLWIGGLIHIGLAMPRWLDELQGVPRTLFAAESFRRFSVLAAFSVLILMISGVLSAFAQFTSFGQLFDTTYGWSLVGKMAAMLPLLAVAGLNAFVLQPRIIAAGSQLQGAAVDDGSRASGPVANLQNLLVTTVRIEATLAIMVLVAVGVLTQLEPARAEAEVEAAITEQSVETIDPEEEYYLEASQAGGLVISLKIDPLQVGQNAFEVGLGSEFGGVGEIDEVRLNFDHEDPEIGQSELVLPLSGSARFSADGANLSIPGNWDVTATIRRRGEDEDVRTSFDVGVVNDRTAGPVAAEVTDDSTIWTWPFEDARSTGAIIALAVGGAGIVVVGGWQLRNIRRRV